MTSCKCCRATLLSDQVGSAEDLSGDGGSDARRHSKLRMRSSRVGAGRLLTRQPRSARTPSTRCGSRTRKVANYGLESCGGRLHGTPVALGLPAGKSPGRDLPERTVCASEGRFRGGALPRGRALAALAPRSPAQIRNSLLDKALTLPQVFRRGPETGCSRARRLFRCSVFPETANGCTFPSPIIAS